MIKCDAFITNDEVLERTNQKHVARLGQISHSLSSLEECLRRQSYTLGVGKISSTNLAASGVFYINQLHNFKAIYISGYCKINCLFFMDDFKVYGKNKAEIESLESTVQLISQDVGIEVVIKKCGAEAR